MADVAVQYSLAGSSTITFNDGSADQFYINEITGLGGPPLRVPQDDVPFGDGGLLYDSWKGARHIVVDGIFLIDPTATMDQIVVIRNDMEKDLEDCLDSIISPNAGSFVWTPQGQSQRTLVVYQEIPVEFTHEENYLTLAFHFGLVAPAPDWT